MNTTYSITFYSTKIEAELQNLPDGLLAKFIRYMERMEHFGPDLGMPHTKALGSGLFELRLQATEGIARIFYCTMSGRKVVVLHHHIKKTQQIPRKELDIARTRQQELKHGK